MQNRYIMKVTIACLLMVGLLAVQALSAAGESAKADTAYDFYFGNLHSHTSYSDGESTPAHAYEYARDTAAIDFLAVTDHHTNLTASEYADILLQAETYTQDGVFVAIAGQEWTGQDTTYEVPNHITIWEADHVFTAPWNNLDSCYSELLVSGCTACFCHPKPGCFNDFGYSPSGDVSINTVEVRRDQEQARYIDILNNGWHVGVDGSQDNHNANWGATATLTVTLACSLTKADILDAVRSHRTYSTVSTNLQLTFKANGHWMGEIFSHADNIPFSIRAEDPEAGDHIKRIELYQNGFLLNWIALDSSSCSWQPEITPPAGQNYYFVKVRQEGPSTAWSSPIWIHCTPSLPSTPRLSQPADIATLASLYPTMTWYSSGSADSYRLQYSTSSGFPPDSTSWTIQDINDTSYTFVDELEDETTYYWRVLADNSQGSSTYSGTRSLTIDADALFSSYLEMRLTADPWDDVCPVITHFSSELWLVWSSNKDGNGNLYYRTSADHGETWSGETQLTDDIREKDDASPAVLEDLEGKMWVAWDGARDGDYEILYKIYQDSAWSDWMRITDNHCEDITPSIIQSSDSLVWVFWSSDCEDDNYEIYYKTFDGDTWSGETRLTDNEYPDYGPRSIYTDNGDIWTMWFSKRSEKAEGYHIYYKVFDGISWSQDNRVPCAYGQEFYPSITQRSDGKLLIGYVQGKWLGLLRFPWAGNLFYKTFQDGYWSDESMLPASIFNNRWSSVTHASDGRMWIAYSSIRDGNEDIYAQRSNYSIPPEAVDDLSAKLADDDISLWWSMPGNTQVDRYIIYRSASWDSLSDSLACTTDTTYLDVGATGDTAANYFYRVRVVDSAGNKSVESNPVGEFDMNLSNVK